jgi:transposase-like protein
MADVNDSIKALIKSEIKNCKTMKDLMRPEGLMAQLKKNLVEGILEEELNEHLGYEKHDPKGKHTGNSRNGYSSKTVRSSDGEIELEIPRDRNSSFEPQFVKKHQKDLSELEQKIICMYARGMTVRDIQAHLEEIYGIDISPGFISSATEKIMGIAKEWQNRALSAIYVITYFDAIHYKVRDNGQILSKAVYTSIGINIEGEKEILGIWVGDSEGAYFWTNVFQEIKNRGVTDILIACVDGLKGLPDAINVIFPKAEVQLCVVHMIRNSLKFISYKHSKVFLADLGPVYKAVSLQAAELALQNFIDKWQKQYPLAVKPWITHWENIIPAFKYPAALRRIMYTTNTIEAVHRQFRKYTKAKSVFPNDDALFKQLYLVIQNVKMAKTVYGWNTDILPVLAIMFEERISMYL